MNTTSIKKLKTCHADLIRLCEAVNKVYPIQVICGERGEADQNKAFAEKKSKLKFPDSKHNKKPSLAVDCVPDPDNDPKTIAWNNIKEFEIMLLVFESKAEELGIKIRLGRDFKFKDFPHIELRG
jgi:peptidoglycan L-alanyl-D-glutamate endopeptidase CwlK